MLSTPIEFTVVNYGTDGKIFACNCTTQIDRKGLLNPIIAGQQVGLCQLMLVTPNTSIYCEHAQKGRLVKLLQGIWFVELTRNPRTFQLPTPAAVWRQILTQSGWHQEDYTEFDKWLKSNGLPVKETLYGVAQG